MLGLSVIILFKSVLHVFCSLVFSAHNTCACRPDTFAIMINSYYFFAVWSSFCHVRQIAQFREAAVTMKCDYILGEYTDLMDAWKVYQGVALYRWGNH